MPLNQVLIQWHELLQFQLGLTHVVAVKADHSYHGQYYH